MSTYLVITRGRELDARFSLDKAIENTIGRGLECHIQLNDPQSSRVHARFLYRCARHGGPDALAHAGRNTLRDLFSKADIDLPLTTV